MKKKTNNYLKNIKKWNKFYAYKIAKLEGIVIKKKHWKIIKFFRKFYFKFHTTPSMRILLKAINYNSKKKIDSIYLFKLFPKSPALQASKIAGLPKPKKCL
ncbi:TusE/DsrC/DsvC family sulfur relay protein [Buchnera aphidicola]|uniref:TusE/DsrC/DsvC family sulfur relay protein n=1 Tax=Buchnera aphidicola TaxID=9 RepID=UPI0030EF5BB3